VTPGRFYGGGDYFRKYLKTPATLKNKKFSNPEGSSFSELGAKSAHFV